MGRYNKLWVVVAMVALMVLLDVTETGSGQSQSYLAEVVVGLLGAGGVWAVPNRDGDEGEF